MAGMCRLLGMVSRMPARLAGTLAGVLEPFTELSCEHPDGWGVASWQDGRIDVVKDVVPARSSARYAEAVGVVTDAAVLHLRKASPGLPVEPRNTHPFVAGSIAFAHNGYFTPVDAVDELIDADLLAAAGGTTDSERYFRRILTRLRGEDPMTAIALAAADIRARTSFGSLNCQLLTEDALYAYADEDPESEVSRRRGPDFFRMRYHAGPDRVVIASSGLGELPDWSVLPYRQVLRIDRANLDVRTYPAADPAVIG